MSSVIDEVLAHRGSEHSTEAAPYSAEVVSRLYDPIVDLAARGVLDSEFMNFGYWYPHTSGTRQASENLMRRLVEGLPRKHEPILDVACGLGATTRFLTGTWDPSLVTGINFTARQIEHCRTSVPECKFIEMDASHLEFPDELFGSIICVEAAMHFNTRESFLRDAVRTLRPGGALAMTDVLHVEEMHRVLPSAPAANYVPSLDQYRELLLATGFAHVMVFDITEVGVRSFIRHVLAAQVQKASEGKMTYTFAREFSRRLHETLFLTRHNLLVFAQKKS